jgi:hypothetical protein
MTMVEHSGRPGGAGKHQTIMPMVGQQNLGYAEVLSLLNLRQPATVYGVLPAVAPRQCSSHLRAVGDPAPTVTPSLGHPGSRSSGFLKTSCGNRMSTWNWGLHKSFLSIACGCRINCQVRQKPNAILCSHTVLTQSGPPPEEASLTGLRQNCFNWTRRLPSRNVLACAAKHRLRNVSQRQAASSIRFD